MTHVDKVVSTTEYMCSRDMAAAPLGRKLIAINLGGVACFEILTKRNLQDYIAWAPLPKMPKVAP